MKNNFIPLYHLGYSQSDFEPEEDYLKRVYGLDHIFNKSKDSSFFLEYKIQSFFIFLFDAEQQTLFYTTFWQNSYIYYLEYQNKRKARINT